MFRVYRSRCAAGLIFAALAGAAIAQVRPDSGRVLEDSRTGGAPQPPRPAPRLDLQEPVRPALTAPDSYRVLVKGFRITRATAFAEASLTPLLRAYVGRELGLADLEEAASVITRFYRDRGYLVARAYVPAQEIREGIVEITVLEGRLGALKIFVPEGRRSETSPRLVRGIISANQPPGSVIRSEGLERGLLLLSDTPGITARATLSPGEEPGTSDLTVDVGDPPVLTGSADIDNFGNRYTGAFRLGGTAFLNSPGGIGDLVTARIQASTGSQNARLGYQMPLGYKGLRVGAAFSFVRYKLCCGFEGADANGSASDFTATGQYPFVRGRNFNLYGSLSASAKRFGDRSGDIKFSDRTVRAVAPGVSGDSRDSAMGGGLNAFSLALTSGKLDLTGAGELSQDEITTQKNGGYSKTNYALSRLQRLGSATSLYVSLSGQMASKNLDSSEQFALGGPYGVRAYPTGEAIGDEGMLVAVEGRWQFRDNWQASVFLDRGQIRLHKNEWLGWQGLNTTITNAYSLTGTGLGLDYSRPGRLLLRMMLAKKLGTNSGRDVNGNDADGRDSKFRGWIQGIVYF
jgi:hemolysin activation/secretion protein